MKKEFELSVYAMLLLMRQWAVGNGVGQYVRCPAEMNVPGGDAYMARTVEVEEEGGEVRREIVVTREAGAYQAAEARNRLLGLQNELAVALKSERCFREQAMEARADAAQRAAAMVRMREVSAEAEALRAQISEVEPLAAEPGMQCWTFPEDLSGVRLVVEA